MSKPYRTITTRIQDATRAQLETRYNVLKGAIISLGESAPNAYIDEALAISEELAKRDLGLYGIAEQRAHDATDHAL